jgi:type IV fimbrial biogenesis protein FimT
MTPARRGGVTLIELVVVLAIGAILTSVALPDLRGMIRSHQLRVAVNDLFGAINLARTQAIARGRRVQLVPAGAAGDTSPEWRRGWVVFVDQDGDRRPGAGEEVIMTHGPLAEGIVVSAAFSSQQGSPYLAYNSMGRSCSDTSSLAARWGTLSLALGGQTRRIRINMLGRARICNPARDGASCGGAGQDP